MRVYAEKPLRITAQVLFDLLAIAWCVLFFRLTKLAHGTVLDFEDPGFQMMTAGENLSRSIGDAANTARQVPFVGDDLGSALGRGTGAGTTLTTAGSALVDVVNYLGTGVAVLVALIGLVPLLRWWLLPRLRYARKAGTAVALRDGAIDLLALRALSTASYRALRRVAPDPAASRRSGDQQVIDELAALHLRRLGLRTPDRAPAELTAA